MPVPNNVLQQVITYQKSQLALLLNSSPFISTANTKFKDFNTRTANLGDTVSFDLPPRFTTVRSLVAQFESAEQRVINLVCNNPISTSYAFTAEQFIFNVQDYMKEFGNSAVAEIGSVVEADVARVCVENTYRFFGDGITQINSFTQLAKAVANLRNFGAAKMDTKGYISDLAQPDIVGSGLNQFANDRNNELANSWELGSFAKTKWYNSNLLPVHEAGTLGNTGAVLTVTGVSTNSDGQIIAITFSGAGTDSDAVREFDKFQFLDGVSGLPNIRFRTFIGHHISGQPVQFRATANAVSSAGNVTIQIDPPLQAASGKDQNLSTNIQVGMQVKGLPSHRAGMITSGDPLFIAMPRLPEQYPFPTANEADPSTGVSLRMTYGSLFGQNQMGNIHDAIWGKTMPSEYAIGLIFPL